MSELALALAEATKVDGETVELPEPIYMRLLAATESAWNDVEEHDAVRHALQQLLLRNGDLDARLAALVSSSLAEIASGSMQNWEVFAATEFWRNVFAVTPAAAVERFVRSRANRPKVLLALGDVAVGGREELRKLAAEFLSRAVQREDVFAALQGEAASTWTALAVSLVSSTEMLTASTSVRKRLATNGEATGNHRLDDAVAAYGLDRDRASEFLETLNSSRRAGHFQESFRQALPRLHARLAEVAPHELAQYLVAHTRHGNKWKPLDTPRMVGWPTITPPLAFAMRSFLGRVAALEAASREVDLAQQLRDYGERYGSWRLEQLGPGSIEMFTSAAGLWAAVLRVHEYQYSRGDSGQEGARLRVESAAQSDPELWADCLEDLLEVAPDLSGLVEAITVDLSSHASINSAVIRLSERARSLRIVERAVALRACVAGVSDPNDKTARRLLSFAAELVDGRPIFPVPLALRSSTWLTSTALEQHLRDSIKRSALKFAEYARDQGRGEEEGLTAVLLKELEFAFRDANPHAVAAGSKPVAMPGVSLAQKVVPKPIENEWGCDLSLLLKVDMPGVIVERAELVQVKKSQALMATPSATNIWKIESKQLGDLLHRSGTASYWLIAGAGEVLVVPATFLAALAKGSRRHRQKTFNVGYDQVRSAAQPLEHYLVDLLLGLWVGGQSKELLTFAQGKELGMRPRNIVAIDVRLASPDHQW